MLVRGASARYLQNAQAKIQYTSNYTHIIFQPYRSRQRERVKEKERRGGLTHVTLITCTHCGISSDVSNLISIQ